jgi:methylated-DNA-[protein]-cysteine S-methyltransferase
MSDLAYCLFETPLGSCGIAWEEGDLATPGVVFLRLPEANVRKTEARIAQECNAPEASEPPAEIAAVIEQVKQHLDGDMQDFADVQLVYEQVDDFARRVYEAARKVPAGETTTYGALASAVNKPRAARVVGQALGRNRVAIIVPCHRVIAAGGKLGGFSAHLGRSMKVRLLAIEGVKV